MGNPFCHVELNTTDVNKAKAFYTKLFDWELEDIPMPDGAYSMIKVGEGTGGGLMKNPIPGAPSFWLSSCACPPPIASPAHPPSASASSRATRS